MIMKNNQDAKSSFSEVNKTTCSFRNLVKPMPNLKKENLLISPFLVFYIIHSLQLGIGVLDLRDISKPAGHDAWISIIVSGISIHVLLWLLYRVLNKGKGDLIDIHRDLFGKWIGGFLSFLFILYLLNLGFTILRVYIEIIQLWVFPQLSPWFFSLIFLLVIVYFVNNGFRVVTGICFLSTLYTLPILLTFLFPLEFAHYSNLLPIMDHGLIEVIDSARRATLSMSGFELLLIFYPFIKQPERSEKWAHLAIIYTTCIYVFVVIITFIYYNQDQLQHTIWGTVMMWKIIELPAFERFEHLGIAAWLFVVLPNICIMLWGVNRGLIKLFSFNKKMILTALIILLTTASGIIENRTSIELIRKFTGEITFYFIYGYIPFLFLIQLIMTKLRGDKQ
jgi:spore germination protein (amino acid permease)